MDDAAGTIGRLGGISRLGMLGTGEGAYAG